MAVHDIDIKDKSDAQMEEILQKVPETQLEEIQKKVDTKKVLQVVNLMEFRGRMQRIWT